MRITNPPAGHDELSGVSTSDHHTVFTAANAVSAVVEDAAYGVGWNADTAHSPSQNAVYDKIESLVIAVEADQGNVEDEDTGTLFVPPDLIKYTPGVAKAWVQILHSGSRLSPYYNIDSITDHNPGIRTIVFAVAFSTAVYSAVDSQSGSSSEAYHYNHNTFATGSVGHHVRDSADNFIDVNTGHAFFGDQ